jgi:V/A-type H+/Na+-transporting ATPase subunit E
MNGIEKIKERILVDCEAEVSAIRAEAAAESERISAVYNAEAQQEYEKLCAAGEQEAQQRRERLRGVAELEAKKQILALKQEMISEVFEIAVKKLKTLPEDKYVAFASALAAGASRSGEEKVLLSGSDKKLYGAQIVAAANKLLASQGKKASLKLDEETAEIMGGVILRDGRIESNCSIETLVASCRAELAAEVAKLLF